MCTREEDEEEGGGGAQRTVGRGILCVSRGAKPRRAAATCILYHCVTSKFPV